MEKPSSHSAHLLQSSSCLVRTARYKRVDSMGPTTAQEMTFNVQCLYSSRIVRGGIGTFEQKFLFDYLYISGKLIKITNESTQNILKFNRTKPSFRQVHLFLVKAFDVPRSLRSKFKAHTHTFFRRAINVRRLNYGNVPIAKVLQRNTQFPVGSAHAPQSRFLPLFCRE